MESYCRPVLQTFLEEASTIEDSRYAIFGAPFDLTSSHRRGSRFGPDAIRQASQYMETYSSRTGLDLDDIFFSDFGNTFDTASVEEALSKVEGTVGIASSVNNVPVLLGGEHTVTLGALRALKPGVVVDFDAHLDLRDRLLGLKLSHGTFMRRALEELEFRVALVGVRALSKEELAYVGENEDRVMLLSTQDIRKLGVEGASQALNDWMGASSVYVSVDMDVIEPGLAPAVGNPSPEGISVTTLLDIMQSIASPEIVGFDLTEVTPHYDSGTTAAQASHIVLETMYLLESARK